MEITLWNCTEEDFSNVALCRAGERGHFADTPVQADIDGKKIQIAAGGKVVLRPGQSISIAPGQYHKWQGVPGTGDVILFEVSMTNDDNVDNRFYEALPRIPAIEEDEKPERLIFADYPKYTKFSF